MPALKEVRVRWDRVPDPSVFPFGIPAIRSLRSLKFERDVCFFVGENGSGKSTLLEAIARCCGFAVKGGGRSSLLEDERDNVTLADALSLSWLPRLNRGFFMRAETLYDYAGYIDDLARDDPSILGAYGGKSLHAQSHGESFLALLQNRLNGRGIYLLDEPEAALSPQRQLALLRVIRNLVQDGGQVIVATHSPIVLAYPGAELFSFDEGRIRRTTYEETDHYQVTKGFLNNRERILDELFREE